VETVDTVVTKVPFTLVLTCLTGKQLALVGDQTVVLFLFVVDDQKTYYLTPSPPVPVVAVVVATVVAPPVPVVAFAPLVALYYRCTVLWLCLSLLSRRRSLVF
jgi:hypothetical protein